MHCHAHLVSVSIWPGNRVTPCCVWGGPAYDSIDSMKSDLNDRFASNNIPAWCQSCSYKDGLSNFSAAQGLQMLDIRNDNICNLKCRSCGPQWSSRWASEKGVTPIRVYQPFDINQLDLTNLKSIYYCGGEPFLSEQHVEVLQSVPNPGNVRLVYNTNCTTLHWKDQYIPDLWDQFDHVLVNASIDAVGPAAEAVRSGTVWADVEAVLKELRDLESHKRISVSVTPVVSALNIWWFDQWLEYFDSWSVDRVWPINTGGETIGLGIIPKHLRGPIVDMLSQSKFAKRFESAVNILTTQDYTSRWPSFYQEQLDLDQLRNENWQTLLSTSRLWA